MSFVRIRLTFQRALPLTDVKNCWFLVDTSTCSTIADLEYLIKKRFFKLNSVNLFLDDYLLPSQEKIEIIQNNDNIRVEMQHNFHFMKIKLQESKDEESDDQDTETNVKRKKKKSRLSDASTSKRKLDEDSEDVLNDRKRKKSKLAKKGVQDGNATKNQTKKPKKDKLSSQDSRKSVKESKIEKTVHKKHKSNLDPVAANNDRALLEQQSRKSTKTFPVPSTSTTSTQLSTSGKSSKGKAIKHSKTDHKPVNPSQRLSDVGKRKNTSEPLKTNLRISKISVNGKGKDIYNGKDSVDSDSSSSDSSSSTESSSESKDESGPSHSKVNGTTFSPVTTEARIHALIINDQSTLPERLAKYVQNKMSVEKPNGKKGKDEIRLSSKSSLALRGKTKGDGAARTSASSSDTDKSEDEIMKDASSSLSSSIAFSLSAAASSSSENEKENAKIENTNKKTSSSLLHPLSPPSSLPTLPLPSVYRKTPWPRTQMEDAEKTNRNGQVKAKQSTSRRQNENPDSSLSTSHIRFDSEESEEETTCSSLEVSLSMATSMAGSKQNDQTMSKKAASELKAPALRNYSLCTPLHGPPRSRDKIAYKVLELSASYTPEVSSYKEGTVLSFDPSSGAVKVELTKESLKKTRGDGNVTGKFELVYDEGEENTDNLQEESPEVVVLWKSMIDVVLID